MPGWGIRFTSRTSIAVELCFLVLLAAFLAPLARAEERLQTIRAEFHQQTDPVRRAKLFNKLGNTLIAEMRRLESTRQYEAVAPLFLEYRDSAIAAYNGLTSSGRDAEKHSGGYRELEMQLRQGAHQLNDLVFGLPLADRDPLRAPQREVEELDEKLVRALFPHTPEEHKTPPSTPPAHPVQ